ncbi:MAG TPA: hypothetical protein VGA59_03760 [Ramlibacter sp.]
MPNARLAEAARYTLLRRLAPSMRHHLVVNLQPIGMIYEVMERRLRAPEPDLGEVHDSAQKINGFARAALNSCLDVVSWLAPEDGAVSTVDEGVRECLGLLATSLTFRGYSLRNDVGSVPGEIGRSAIRNVLTAAIIHMTDETPPVAGLVLSAQASPAALGLTLTLEPTEGNKGFATETPYRPLAWADLEALAAAEGVGLTREGRQRVGLSIPWAGARG